VLVQAPVPYGSELARRFVRIDNGPTVQRVFATGLAFVNAAYLCRTTFKDEGRPGPYLPVVGEEPY
jgi:hypothetical protein